MIVQSQPWLQLFHLSLLPNVHFASQRWAGAYILVFVIVFAFVIVLVYVIAFVIVFVYVIAFVIVFVYLISHNFAQRPLYHAEVNDKSKIALQPF